MWPIRKFHFKPMLFHLFCTYSLISLSIVIILGGSLYYFFSAKYKEQVMIVNNRMIQQEKSAIESSYLQKIQSLYLELSSSNLNGNYDDFVYFFENRPDGSYSRLSGNVDYLKKVLLNYDGVVDAIHIYVPKSRLLLSTTWGIQYLDSLPASYPDSIPWFSDTTAPPAGGRWIDTRPMRNAFYPSDTSNGLTYVRVFPLFNKGLDQPGVIAMDMNCDYISAVLQKYQISAGDNTFIINGSGNVIFSPDSAQLYANLNKSAYVSRILKQNAQSGNFIQSVNRTSSMVSYDTITLTNWKIVSVTPCSEYYKQVAVIRNIFWLLCFLTLGISIGLTFAFSQKVYHPVNMIVRNIQSLFSAESNAGLRGSLDETGNEYLLISGTIGNLSQKISTLQPIARQNMLVSMLSHTIESSEEFLAFEKLSNTYFNYPFFNCMVVEIDKQKFGGRSIQKIFYENYTIVKHIDEMSGDAVTLHPLRLSRYRIGILINAKSDSYAAITALIEKLLFYTIQEFDITFTAFLGKWSDNPLLLSDCYAQALKCAEYPFYYPNRKLILYPEIEKRETGLRQCPLPDSEFLQALHLQDMELVRKYMHDLTELFTQPDYSASYCSRKLQDMVDMMSQFIRSRLPDSPLGADLMPEYQSLTDIYQYSAWMTAKAQDVFQALADKKRMRNFGIIQNVKEYIDKNIGYSLSLESAAGSVNLTPKYLSKVFKDVTGVNFHDYLTEQRLRKGLQLLADPKQSVDQISQQIGYSSAAYFIRQFKKYYGDTPSRYRAKIRSGIREG